MTQVQTHKPLGNEWINSSVSWGTMHAYDVATAILGVIYSERPELALKIIAELPGMVAAFEEGRDAEYWYSEECSFDLNETLWDAMDAIAPEGTYFGSHPGDCSDYGFWTVDDYEE